MNDSKLQIAQALANVQQNPYVLDPALEQAAQSERAPLHPLVAGLMKRLGLLSMFRNQGNRTLVDPELPLQ